MYRSKEKLDNALIEYLLEDFDEITKSENMVGPFDIAEEISESLLNDNYLSE